MMTARVFRQSPLHDGGKPLAGPRMYLSAEPGLTRQASHTPPNPARSSPGGEGSAAPQLEPGHRPPVTPAPASPRGQGRHQRKPPAAFHVTASGTQFRRPGAAAIGDFHPDHATAGSYRDRNRLPGSARPAVPHAIAESPHGCPGPSTAPTNCRATRARSARPASVALSRTAAPVIGAPALPGPPRQRGSHRDAGRTHRDARSTQRRTSSRETRRQRGPSVAVREKAAGAHRPS